MASHRGIRDRIARAKPALEPALLFTYGTLMRGFPLHGVLRSSKRSAAKRASVSRPLHRRATLIGDARVRGSLVDLGSYPGLVDGRGVVRGELYRLDDPELLRDLDREEGYNFERRRTLVTLDNGRRARAWVYRYRGPRERAVLIPGGDYRRRPRR